MPVVEESEKRISVINARYVREATVNPVRPRDVILTWNDGSRAQVTTNTDEDATKFLYALAVELRCYEQGVS